MFKKKEIRLILSHDEICNINACKNYNRTIGRKVKYDNINCIADSIGVIFTLEQWKEIKTCYDFFSATVQGNTSISKATRKKLDNQEVFDYIGGLNE